jgi:hypothetical protein
MKSFPRDISWISDVRRRPARTWRAEDTFERDVDPTICDPGGVAATAANKSSSSILSKLYEVVSSEIKEMQEMPTATVI